MPTNSYDPLINQMDRIREKRGMTILTWAELAGLSRPTVYRALNGNASIKVAHRLADALGVRLGVTSKIVPLD